MSRRLRGSTTILFLLLQTPEPAAQPFTDRERTVYPRHPLPILFHHLLVSPPSLPPSPSPLPPSLPLSTSPSFSPPPLSRFSRPDSTTNNAFSVSEWRDDRFGKAATHSLRVRSVCRVLGSARNRWMGGGWRWWQRIEHEKKER